MHIIRLGSKGTEVMRLQLLLNSKLGLRVPLKEDGVFGVKTQLAVMALQQKNGLKQDGIVGPKTWTILGQSSKPKPLVHETVAVNASWMLIAQAELGIHENSLPGEHNQRIIEYHNTTSLKATTDEVPWCSSFVNWVITKAGSKGTNSAAAKSWLKWGTHVNVPQRGAVVVIKRKTSGNDAVTGSSSGYHVGFFVTQTPTAVRLLGGNQANQVRYSNFSLTSFEIVDIRWPG